MERGGIWNHKYEVVVTEERIREKGMCVNVKRAGRFLSFLSAIFLVILHLLCKFLFVHLNLSTIFIW